MTQFITLSLNYLSEVVSTKQYNQHSLVHDIISLGIQHHTIFVTSVVFIYETNPRALRIPP